MPKTEAPRFPNSAHGEGLNLGFRTHGMREEERTEKDTQVEELLKDVFAAQASPLVIERMRKERSYHLRMGYYNNYMERDSDELELRSWIHAMDHDFDAGAYPDHPTTPHLHLGLKVHIETTSIDIDVTYDQGGNVSGTDFYYTELLSYTAGRPVGKDHLDRSVNVTAARVKLTELGVLPRGVIENGPMPTDNASQANPTQLT